MPNGQRDCGHIGGPTPPLDWLDGGTGNLLVAGPNPRVVQDKEVWTLAMHDFGQRRGAHVKDSWVVEDRVNRLHEVDHLLLGGVLESRGTCRRKGLLQSRT